MVFISRYFRSLTLVNRLPKVITAKVLLEQSNQPGLGLIVAVLVTIRFACQLRHTVFDIEYGAHSYLPALLGVEITLVKWLYGVVIIMLLFAMISMSLTFAFWPHLASFLYC